MKKLLISKSTATRRALVEVIAENLRWSATPNKRGIEPFLNQARQIADALTEQIQKGIHGREQS